MRAREIVIWAGRGCPDTPTNKATVSLGSHDRGLSLLHSLPQPYPKQYVNEVDPTISSVRACHTMVYGPSGHVALCTYVYVAEDI